MKPELIQAAATITASILESQARANLARNSGPMQKDAVQKAFVHTYQQLEAAVAELEQRPTPGPQKG